MADKVKQEPISLEEYMRISGFNDRTKFAAKGMFANQTHTKDEWEQEFIKNKLK